MPSEEQIKVRAQHIMNRDDLSPSAAKEMAIQELSEESLVDSDPVESLDFDEIIERLRVCSLQDLESFATQLNALLKTLKDPNAAKIRSLSQRIAAIEVLLDEVQDNQEFRKLMREQKDCEIERLKLEMTPIKKTGAKKRYQIGDKIIEFTGSGKAPKELNQYLLDGGWVPGKEESSALKRSLLKSIEVR